MSPWRNSVTILEWRSGEVRMLIRSTLIIMRCEPVPRALGEVPAAATGTAFFDLSTAVADQFEKLGAEKTAALYPQDHTHFNAPGADLHAATVVNGLKKLPGNPLAKFVK